jgi:uroporphyrinogen-III synthase
MPFDGLRVLSLESRRAKDMETLILRYGGEPFVAPSVREEPIEDPSAGLGFIESLEAGEFDLVICMTGAGLAYLRDAVASHMPAERVSAALRRAVILSRGPKPVAVLRSLSVPVEITIPEPNTWKEIVQSVAARPERCIAVQEYGRPSTEMNAALEALGARESPITLYRWALPTDIEPLKSAARRLANREADLVLFTTSVQLDHLLDIARSLKIESEVKDALTCCAAVASIGPVMSATLEGYGIPADIVPKHPKMASLVIAAAEESHSVLARKRG